MAFKVMIMMTIFLIIPLPRLSVRDKIQQIRVRDFMASEKKWPSEGKDGAGLEKDIEKSKHNGFASNSWKL